LAQVSGTSSWRGAAAAAKPAIARFRPAVLARTASPRESGGQPSASSNRSNVAGWGAKLFVSWFSPPTAILGMLASPERLTIRPARLAI
jgi:hypothetical protein